MSGGGYPLRMPSIDIAEVGAGGGSIAWIDAGGAPRVGPQSAGALPGPACYDRGGTLATVTDACVVLGYINPVEIAGGAQRIDAGGGSSGGRTRHRAAPRPRCSPTPHTASIPLPLRA